MVRFGHRWSEMVRDGQRWFKKFAVCYLEVMFLGAKAPLDLARLIHSLIHSPKSLKIAIKC